MRAIEAGDCDCALIVAAEKYGVSVPERVIGNGIFVGDGAAATVVAGVDGRSRPAAPRFRSFAFASNGEYHDMMYVKRGGVCQPLREAHDPEDDVYRLHRKLSEPELKQFLALVEETALRLLDDACRAADVQRSEIDLIVTLNGNDGHNQRFISAAGLERCRNTRGFIVEAGHLGGADAAYNLHRACESGLARAGDLVAIYSGGAGYSWAVSLLQM
jgi:3-oxoacyl-[acyl-carrier-protein] synthase III